MGGGQGRRRQLLDGGEEGVKGRKEVIDGEEVGAKKMAATNEVKKRQDCAFTLLHDYRVIWRPFDSVLNLTGE
jgi:hypothetical protein